MFTLPLLDFLILDWHAEEDASHWNHHPRSQPHGNSRVCQGFQGGVQLWWQNIHSVQSGWSEKRQSKKCKCYQYNTSLPYVLKAIYPSDSLFFFKVFVGNTDNDGTKTNMFDPPIVAQYIRIIPVVCRKACTLRMELVGCELNGKFSWINFESQFKWITFFSYLLIISI